MSRFADAAIDGEPHVHEVPATPARRAILAKVTPRIPDLNSSPR